MIGSKQPATTPAAANRPLARSSLARGRGINSSRQTEKNRQEGVGRKGKREPSHPLIFALFHEMDDIDHPLPSSYHSVGNSSRKQASHSHNRPARRVEQTGRKTGRDWEIELG